MNAKKVVGLECPYCGDFVELHHFGLPEATAKGLQPHITQWQCSDCDSLFSTEKEANECCDDSGD